MKLNNRGWGTQEMFLLCGGLLIALLVAIFFIGKLYGSLDRATSKKTYVDIEAKLENAAKSYISNNNIVINEEFFVNYELLKNNGYIDDLNDPNGEPCTGYVSIKNVDSINHYGAFIKCKNYQTSNY